MGTSGLSNYNLTYIVEKSVEIGKPIIGASINYRKSSWGNMYSIELQVSTPQIVFGLSLMLFRELAIQILRLETCERVSLGSRRISRLLEAIQSP